MLQSVGKWAYVRMPCMDVNMFMCVMRSMCVCVAMECSVLVGIVRG